MMELRDLGARVLEEVGVPVAAGVSLSQGMKRLMRILGGSWYRTFPYQRRLGITEMMIN